MKKLLKRIKYFKSNWKVGFHLLFRTKRFGVNNKLWVEWDSMFGWSHKKKIISILKIKPIIENYKMMKFRAGACHFLSDESYELIFGESKDKLKGVEMSADKDFELAKQTFEFYKKLKKEWNSKKGKYVIKDPNEMIVPIDGLVLSVGKRKHVKLKSDIKISALSSEIIKEVNDNLEDILLGDNEKYNFMEYYEGDEFIWVEILGE